MAVPELLDYVRQALDRKFPAVVIRSALKKSGYSDKEISEAFTELRKERPVTPKPAKVKPVKLIQDIPEPRLSETPAMDFPPLPPQVEISHPELAQIDIPAPEKPKRPMNVRHVIAACLFLIAIILLMYAALAPMLLRVS